MRGGMFMAVSGADWIGAADVSRGSRAGPAVRELTSRTNRRAARA